ncbi:hypothetical protein [Streptomyces chrestomyceticus]|uniref:hypothetical protein n=1 Tax=Streptomyces chrestomyceticus TaxID=68185 RepID=UPI0019D1738C
MQGGRAAGALGRVRRRGRRLRRSSRACRRGRRCGPDARQAGSVFLNPPLTRAQAHLVRTAGGPAYRDDFGTVRTSAGWLLQLTGCHPGSRIAPGVRCSTGRALTLTARAGATSDACVSALHSLACRVREVITTHLHPEPVRISEDTRGVPLLARCGPAPRLGGGRARAGPGRRAVTESPRTRGEHPRTRSDI